MKQFAKQKWVLSALLITALGSQYYFSTSSNNISSLEMSSNAEVQALQDATAILQKTVALPPTPPPEPAAVSVPASVTTAVAPSVPCPECVVLTKAEAEKLRKILAEVVASKTAAAADVPVNETALEKRTRLREEAAEKKRLAAQDKTDKLRDEKIARNDEFKEKMEDAADRCAGDVSCIASRYTSLLSRYSGRRKIDMSTATAAYAKYVQPGLKAAVSADGNDSLAQETLRSISLDIPLEYRAIKEASVTDIKTVARERALEVNKNFRLADQYSKAKKYSESNEAFQEATAGRKEFEHDMKLYQSTMSDSLSEDAATLAFMQKNFMPEVSRLFTNLNNLDGLSVAGSSTGSSGNRNARSGNSPIASTLDGKTTTFGTPAATSRIGRSRN